MSAAALVALPWARLVPQVRAKEQELPPVLPVQSSAAWLRVEAGAEAGACAAVVLTRSSMLFSSLTEQSCSSPKGASQR